MIFAHAPAGFLAAFLTKPFWKKKYGVYSKRTTALFLFLGALGGLVPDIDLFFYYLHDASSSHRDMLTHKPVLYLGFGLIAFGCAALLRRPRWCIGISAFTLGALSHMLTDTVTAQIQLLYPLSQTYFGVADFGNAFIIENSLFLNFLMEGTFFVVALTALIRLCVHRVLLRVLLIVVAVLLYALGVGAVFITNQHIYHSPIDIAFGDMDADGIVNGDDRDMDGDGALNIEDEDSDNDGKGNAQGIVENSEQFLSMWYDPSNGGLIQIPARLGFITNEDLPRRLFGTIGIHLRAEMVDDWQLHPDGYALPPTDENFDRTNANLRAWLEHAGRLQTDERLATERNRIGDILFFESGRLTVVTGFNQQGEAVGLDVHPDRPITEVTIDTLEQHEGPVTTRGSLLSRSSVFYYSETTSGVTSVYAMHAKTLEKKKIFSVNDTYGQYHSVSFSPQAHTFAYTDKYNLYVYDQKSGSTTTVISSTETDEIIFDTIKRRLWSDEAIGKLVTSIYHPTFSPCGRYMHFVGGRYEGADNYIVDLFSNKVSQFQFGDEQLDPGFVDIEWSQNNDLIATGMSGGGYHIPGVFIGHQNKYDHADLFFPEQLWDENVHILPQALPLDQNHIILAIGNVFESYHIEETIIIVRNNTEKVENELFRHENTVHLEALDSNYLLYRKLNVHIDEENFSDTLMLYDLEEKIDKAAMQLEQNQKVINVSNNDKRIAITKQNHENDKTFKLYSLPLFTEIYSEPITKDSVKEFLGFDDF